MDGLSRGFHGITAARGRVLYAGGMATAQVVPRDNQPLSPLEGLEGNNMDTGYLLPRSEQK